MKIQERNKQYNNAWHFDRILDKENIGFHLIVLSFEKCYVKT